jgi:glutaminyl-tRNA synthetase
MSKRKILKLVQGGYVSGWDDPRIYTLIALRRRGVPPGAIISFVNQLGVTTANTIITISRFEQSIRQHLEMTTPRLMLVLHPVKVVIENLPEDHFETIEKPLHPKVPEMGSVKVPFTRTIYIEEADFRTQDAKDYFRLAPGKTVGLLGLTRPITCTTFTTDEATGKVTEIQCRLEEQGAVKPKGWIHWVAEHAASASPVRVNETRIFKPLFKSDDPAALDDFLADINPDSLEIVKDSLIEVAFWDVARREFAQAREEAKRRTEEAARSAAESGGDAKEEKEKEQATTPVRRADQLVGNEVVRFQAVRTAYFALDSDSVLPGITNDGDSEGKETKVVLNWIVSLKEDAGKKAEDGGKKKGAAANANAQSKKGKKGEPGSGKKKKEKEKAAAAAANKEGSEPATATTTTTPPPPTETATGAEDK